MTTLKKEKRYKLADREHLYVKLHTFDTHFPLHWHNYFELEIILYGKGTFIINDVSYDISQNNLFLMTPTDFHKYEIEETTCVLNISFDEDFVDEKDIISLLFLQTRKAYALPADEYQRLVKAAELLLHEHETNGGCQKQLLQYILNCIFRKNTVSHASDFSTRHYRGIKKSIIYMEIHFREPLTLQMLASEAGYHPTYFSELFKKVTGETYIAYLNKLRVGYARTLLSNGFSVSESCFLSGFGSLSNFGTIFKKNCGLSPHEYAKRQPRDG